MTTQTPFKLLHAREVADRLSVCTETVLRLALAGKLPSVKATDKLVRFHPDDVEDYINSRRATRVAHAQNEDRT